MGVDVVVPAGRGVRAALDRFAGLRLGPDDALWIVDELGEVPDGPNVVAGTGEGTPGAARNAGAAAGAAEWLLFLDDDVLAPNDLVAQLFAEPVDPSVGAIAGGVQDAPGRRFAERWAAARGSMTQELVLAGPRPFAIAAHLAVRRTAFEALRGFAADTPAGEDADFCFRLADAGWALEPRLHVAVQHESRPTVAGLLRQRHGHGGGAAWVDERWPGAMPPRRPLAGLAWWGVRRALAGVVALGLGDRDRAATGLLDGPTALAFELGRRRYRR